MVAAWPISGVVVRAVGEQQRGGAASRVGAKLTGSHLPHTDGACAKSESVKRFATGRLSQRSHRSEMLAGPRSDKSDTLIKKAGD